MQGLDKNMLWRIR